MYDAWFYLVFIKIIAIFYKYQNEAYFYSIEITKTGILFRFNTLTMETENNCKYCEVKHADTHAHSLNYPFTQIHRHFQL